MPRPIPSELFDYEPNRKQFSAEASTLQGHGHNFCKTLAIKSARTGDIKYFEHTYTHTVGSAEDLEIASWMFRCEDPDFEDLTICVIND